MPIKENYPGLWLQNYPRKAPQGHKYDAGMAIIYGAPQLTGATRLAAEACARIGAGLTTVIAPAGTMDVYRTSLPAHIMVRADEEKEDARNAGHVSARVGARLYGPGGLAASSDFTTDIPTVLDAEALRVLPRTPLGPHYVLTPHEGEFAKAFPELRGERVARAQEASTLTGAVIVLKGAETIVAAPERDVVINHNAPPSLATAGSGDVLAGMITGLMAQGMEPFDAACAGVWIHGACARAFGPGLVSSDLIAMIPGVLAANIHAH